MTEPSDTDLRDELWLQNPCPGCVCIEQGGEPCCWCGESLEGHQ